MDLTIVMGGREICCSLDIVVYLSWMRKVVLVGNACSALYIFCEAFN